MRLIFLILCFCIVNYCKSQDLYVLTIQGTVLCKGKQVQKRQMINAHDTLLFKSNDANILLFSPKNNTRIRIPNVNNKAWKSEFLKELVYTYYKDKIEYFTGAKGTSQQAIDSFKAFVNWYFPNDSLVYIPISSLESTIKLPIPQELDEPTYNFFLKSPDDIILIKKLDNQLIINRESISTSGQHIDLTRTQGMEFWIGNDKSRIKSSIGKVKFIHVQL